jgi:nucleoid DNA-binding protein
MAEKRQDCNIQLLKDVVASTGETPAQVKSVVTFFNDFIAHVIKEDAFESVLVPYFGKFQPKIKELQWAQHYKGVAKPEKPNTDNNGTAI